MSMPAVSEIAVNGKHKPMLDVRRCSKCGGKAQVTNSRDLGDVILRWRKCDPCDLIWKTTETR